jgi:PAS domain S-box-containing protein
VKPLPSAVVELVRERLEREGAGRSFRVWAPGCRGPEDAHLLAASLLDVPGGRWRELDLRVYAMLADAPALSRARDARCSAAAVRRLPPRLRERAFTPEGDSFRARPFVRQACRFAAHGPGARPPLAGLDLIAFRGAPLPSFHGALAAGGLLLPLSDARVREGALELFTPAGPGCYAPKKGLCALDLRLADGGELARALFERSAEAVLVRDVETDVILEANAAAARLYGFPVEELVGLHAMDLVAPSGASRRPARERRSDARLALPHHRRKDGSLFAVEVSITPLTLRGRASSLWTVRDAGQSLRAAALREARGRERAQDELMGEIVHELRNPMALISGSAEVLREGVSHPGARARLLRSIEGQTRRMSAMVERLLDLGGARSSERVLRPATVPLAGVVAELVWTFEPLARRRGISIRMDIPAGLSAYVDPSDLPHIFGNLLDNAIKYNRSGGVVEVAGRAAGSEAVVSVRDTGKGVPAADLGRLFERFYRGEGARKARGTGLGLAIVGAMASANGGRVYAENHPEGGAVFSLALPLAAEDGAHD